jgi:FkbM family methyltransferase
VHGSLKQQAQALLTRMGIYHRLKASSLYNVYWMIANPTLLANERREVEFYRRTLVGFRKGDLIFDIGANIGHKSQQFLRLGARVIAVDPDVKNQRILKKTFHSLRLFKKPITIVGSAVSNKTGSETMWVDQPGSAKNTLNTKWVETLRHDPKRFGENLTFRAQNTVTTVTMEDLITKHGRPFFVKIDVEGYESVVLSGMRTPVPVLSFEVNLPEFQPEALECIRHLEKIAPGGTYNIAADCIRGMSYNSWLKAGEVNDAIGNCLEASIEVFWRAPKNDLHRSSGASA